MKNRKGVTLGELVISTVVLAVVMLGTAGFAVNFMDASSKSSRQMLNVIQARNVYESISKEIANAAYIYPANTDIALTSSDNGPNLTINTNDAVAMLYENDNGGAVNYGFTAFFLVNNTDGSTDLYQFTESPSHDWPEDTSPAVNLVSFDGNSSKIITDINTANTSLSYIMSYSNGIIDETLLGEVGGADATDENALIKGIDWQIVQSNLQDQRIKIKELSRNVPRFYED